MYNLVVVMIDVETCLLARKDTKNYGAGLWTVSMSLMTLVVRIWSWARLSRRCRLRLATTHATQSHMVEEITNRTSKAKTHRPEVGMGLGYQIAQKISTTISPKMNGMATAAADIRRNWSSKRNETTTTTMVDISLIPDQTVVCWTE